MEFWTAVAVLRRRWYVFMPGVARAHHGRWRWLVGQVKPTYKAFGTVKLQVPARSATPRVGCDDPTTSWPVSPSPTRSATSIGSRR